MQLHRAVMRIKRVKFDPAEKDLKVKLADIV